MKTHLKKEINSDPNSNIGGNRPPQQIGTSQQTSETSETSLQDMTGQQLWYRRLEARDQETLAVFESISEIILIIEAKGKNITVIPTRLDEKSGLKAAIINQTIQQFYDSEQSEQWLELIRQVFTTQQTLEFEYSLLVEERTFWFSACVSPKVQSQSVLWVAHDITQSQQSQHWLQLLERGVAASSNGIVITDATNADNPIIYVNPGFERITGYNREEVIGKNSRFLQGTDRNQPSLEELRQAIIAGKSCYVTLRNYRKDGSLFWNELTISPVINERQKVTHYIGIQTDITERKQAEEERNHFFFQSINLLCIADFNGYFTRINPAWERTLGYTQAELLATPFIEFVHPEDREKTLKEAEKLSQGINVISFENRYRCQDGSYRWLVWNSTAVLESKLIYAVVYDITERKQIEEALKRQALTFANISDGIIITNLEGIIIDWNPASERMFGYSKAEVLGKSAEFLYTPEEAKTLTAKIIRSMIKNCRWSGEITVIRKDKTQRICETTVVPLEDEQGKIIAAIGVNRDITETVKIREQLKTSQMLLAGVLNSSLDGIMAFKSVRDETGKIIDFEWLLINPSACEIIGRSETELLGKRMLEELPVNKEEGLFERYIQVVETGEPQENEFYYEHEGIKCWFMNIAVKLEDGFAVTFRNITQTKQSELQLQQLNDELESRLNQLQQRNLEMLLLSQMNDFLQACLTLEEAYKAFRTLIKPLFPGCSGGIFITKASRDFLEAVATWGNLPIGETIFHPKDCWCLRRGREHWVDGDEIDLFCDHSDRILPPKATLCLPMMAQGETLGLLYLYSDSRNHLDENKRQLARTVAEQMALAITNLQLREKLQNQSIRDPLTGLYNRRYLEESLEQEINRARRHQHSIGVIMIDIDHFKRFNDTFGHDGGDAVLKEVGKLLKSHLRSSDIACRYGGEEMTLILPEASLEITYKRAEEIRQFIKQINIENKRQSLGTITASFGVACFPQHGISGDAVIQVADNALYQAKKQGRDQVVIAEVE
ncbi:sensor domain-containing diguanylate cyclase [Limnoraphis robusta]|uniref:sensor domain-containing diguanylate cyclase n=1 Tax=Limnoraphis robusta TaxID=1118279 RepID=UPI00069F04BA|nr:sensor domain-containing diguanylate cyclase [Limnoraphis robusta]MEA5499097.1 PAS domain S-box protein [Limnoraphis robusta BA-68 BA1]